MTSDLILEPPKSLADPGATDRNPALVYLGSLAEGGRRTMGQALGEVALIITDEDYSDLPPSERKAARDNLARFYPWENLRFEHTTLIRTALAERYAPATASKMLSALRGTLKAAWRLDLMSAEDYQKAIDLDTIKNETLPAGRNINPGEINGLFNACGTDPAGVRDAATIALLYACGLRRAELVALDLADYDPEAASLVIRGKRNKERLAPVVNGAKATLDDWLTIRGGDDGPLFYPIRKGGHIKPARLTTQAVYHILKERAAQAGVKELSPHDFRRTFVGDLLDAGADIVTVQKLAGHANVTTTGRYDRRPEAAKRKAAALLHVPYTPRVMRNDS